MESSHLHKPKSFRLRGNEAEQFEKLRSRTARRLGKEYLSDTDLIRLMVDYCYSDILGDFPASQKARQIQKEKTITQTTQSTDENPEITDQDS